MAGVQLQKGALQLGTPTAPSPSDCTYRPRVARLVQDALDLGHQRRLLVLRHHGVAWLDGLRVGHVAQIRITVLVAQDPRLALRHDLLTSAMPLPTASAGKALNWSLQLARLAAVPRLGDSVAPILEGALRELHDVALVHQCHRRLAVLQRIVDGGRHQTLGALARDRLDAVAGGGREADFLEAVREIVFQQRRELGALWRALLELDTRI